MANQDVQTKVITRAVKRTDGSVRVKATLSHPKSGGWSVFLDGTFKQGGNDPAEVNLGRASEVIGKMVEVSAVMKNISGAAAAMSLQVDASASPDSLRGDIDSGHAAHYSIFIAFLEEQ
jgi:hypothetical protein